MGMKITTVLTSLLAAASVPILAQENARPPADESDLQYWLSNMLSHQFRMSEIQAATGLGLPQIAAALHRAPEHARLPRERSAADTLTVLPYPGGRHPRIGFLDGAIDPQRETKISVFTPWDHRSYVVADVPEAIWSNLGLTYLAHTHIDTVWTKRGTELPRQEWDRRADGTFKMSRRLPNGIRFGTLVYPQKDHVAMVMWLHNGTNAPLSDLRIQNCVMLKSADGFNALTNDNKILQNPFVVCKSDTSSRWIITAWEPCHRPWANPPVPCLHSDPKFPGLAAGETGILNGWLSFHEGADVQEAMKAIEARWKKRTLDDISDEIASATAPSR